MIPFHPRMGWIKDKWDLSHVPMLVKPAVADAVDLSKWAATVRDQGNEGSCVGFGVGGMLTSTAIKLGVFTEWFSPRWIYNWGRAVEGTLDQDSGCYPDDALDCVVKYGALPEHFWPYVDQPLDKSKPPSKLYPEAAMWPVLTKVRIDGGVDGIMSYLEAGCFVSIGTPWFQSWMNPGPTGVLPEVTNNSAIAGGHETRINKYDRPNRKFGGRNSWGDRWAAGGDYIMPFSAFDVMKAQGGYDAHTVEVRWSTVPQPQPSPSPPPSLIIRLQGSRDGGRSWKTLSQVTP